jgi:site-specific DNA-methyltransferase (adenine-specific)
VVAKKFARRYCGVELDRDYCCWALKRLKLAEADQSIQGYSEGVFWERNSLPDQKPQKARKTRANDQMGLFNE